MNDWYSEFKKDYFPLLDVKVSHEKRGLVPGLYYRAQGFDLIFSTLLTLNKTNYQIIETGSTRNPNNWKDGNSGYLFAEFVKCYGGFVRSVDINQEAVDAANQFIDGAYHRSFCSDSVKWLESLSDLSSIDLFYLDSMDVKWSKDENSAEHHLKEFKAIEPFLSKGKIVAIDDNSKFFQDNKRTGKGRAIYEYLDSKNIKPVYDGHQIIYIW
jgi:hypothetical protein